jgi:hypothetical protein
VDVNPNALVLKNAGVCVIAKIVKTVFFVILATMMDVNIVANSVERNNTLKLVKLTEHFIIEYTIQY